MTDPTSIKRRVEACAMQAQMDDELLARDGSAETARSQTG